MKIVDLNQEPENPFATLVGLKGTTPVGEKRSLWLDDLPGIAQEMPENLRLNDAPGQMWERVQRNAWQTMGESIKNALAGTLVFTRVMAQTSPLEARGKGEFFPASARWECWEIHTPISKWLTLEFHSARIHSVNDPESTVLKLWDLSSGDVLHTIPEITKREITIGKQINLDRGAHVLLGVDCSQLPLYARDSARWCDYYTGLDVVPTNSENGWKSDGSFQVFPSSLPIGTSPVQNNTIVSMDGLTGLEIDVRLTASIEAFITEFKHELKFAYRLLCASLLMDEKLGSPQLNYWAKSNLEFAEDKRNVWRKEFDQTVARAIKAIPLRGQSLCWAADPESFSIGIVSNVG